MLWLTILTENFKAGGGSMDKKTYEKPELIVYEDLKSTTAAAIS
jgi:hypothetical protein